MSTEAAKGFATVCKEASEKEGTCRAAYEALLTCQARDSKCVDGALAIAPCETETKAWQACKGGTTENDAGTCTFLAPDGQEVTAQQEATDFPTPEAGELSRNAARLRRACWVPAPRLSSSAVAISRSRET